VYRLPPLVPGNAAHAAAFAAHPIKFYRCRTNRRLTNVERDGFFDNQIKSAVSTAARTRRGRARQVTRRKNDSTQTLHNTCIARSIRYKSIVPERMRKAYIL
jgi:hypothetical protein